MATLTLKNISKQYKNDDHATLRSIDLTVTDDDFLVLLGLPAVEKPLHCGSLQAWNSQIPARFFWMERM